MIPKVEFRYSEVYDRMYRESTDMQSYLKKKKRKYPSREKILNYANKVEKLWKKYEKQIFTEISKTMKLSWKEKKILCYIIGCGRPFSDPLTIRVYEKKGTFIDTLTHELIHQIQIQNSKKYLKWHRYVLKHYPKEERITKTHILLSAVHWKVLEKLFGKKRVREEIKKHCKDTGYRRAWEIVEKEGADKIIKIFIRLIK